MAREQTYIGTHNGLLALVPQGKDKDIKWPTGTKFRQCVKAPSGHWMLLVSQWQRLRQNQVQSVKEAFEVEEAGDGSPAVPQESA